jgi:hypothetical protein
MNGADRAPGQAWTALQLVHDIPGRLRLRIPRGVRTVGLREAVEAVPGVIASAWSPRTRSLLVQYQAEATTPEDIAAHVARHAGIDEVVAVDPAGYTNGRPAVSAAIVEAVGTVDQGVRRASRGLVGLGLLLPVALTVWAIAEVLRGRTAPLAWSTALWYAHGLFRDYNVSNDRRG